MRLLLIEPDTHPERRYTAIRTALIGYGIVAYSYFVPQLGFPRHANALLIGGLVLQVLLVATRVFIKRTVTDQTLAAQISFIAELIGDGITVLLFSLGTLGAIVHAPDQF